MAKGVFICNKTRTEQVSNPFNIQSEFTAFKAEETEQRIFFIFNGLVEAE